MSGIRAESVPSGALVGRLAELLAGPGEAAWPCLLVAPRRQVAVSLLHAVTRECGALGGVSAMALDEVAWQLAARFGDGRLLDEWIEPVLVAGAADAVPGPLSRRGPGEGEDLPWLTAAVRRARGLGVEPFWDGPRGAFPHTEVPEEAEHVARLAEACGRHLEQHGLIDRARATRLAADAPALPGGQAALVFVAGQMPSPLEQEMLEGLARRFAVHWLRPEEEEAGAASPAVRDRSSETLETDPDVEALAALLRGDASRDDVVRLAVASRALREIGLSTACAYRLITAAGCEALDADAWWSNLQHLARALERRARQHDPYDPEEAELTWRWAASARQLAHVTGDLLHSSRLLAERVASRGSAATWRWIGAELRRQARTSLGHGPSQFLATRAADFLGSLDHLRTQASLDVALNVWLERARAAAAAAPPPAPLPPEPGSRWTEPTALAHRHAAHDARCGATGQSRYAGFVGPWRDPAEPLALRDLAAYQRCPGRFFFGSVLGLPAADLAGGEEWTSGAPLVEDVEEVCRRTFADAWSGLPLEEPVPRGREVEPELEQRAALWLRLRAEEARGGGAWGVPDRWDALVERLEPAVTSLVDRELAFARRVGARRGHRVRPRSVVFAAGGSLIEAVAGIDRLDQDARGRGLATIWWRHAPNPAGRLERALIARALIENGPPGQEASPPPAPASILAVRWVGLDPSTGQVRRELWTHGAVRRVAPALDRDVAELVDGIHRGDFSAAGAPAAACAECAYRKACTVRVPRDELVAWEVARLAEVLGDPSDAPAVVSVLRSRLFGVADDRLAAHRQDGGSWLPEPAGEGDGSPTGDPVVNDALGRLHAWAEAAGTTGLAGAVFRACHELAHEDFLSGLPGGEEDARALRAELERRLDAQPPRTPGVETGGSRRRASTREEGVKLRVPRLALERVALDPGGLEPERATEIVELALRRSGPSREELVRAGEMVRAIWDLDVVRRAAAAGEAYAALQVNWVEDESPVRIAEQTIDLWFRDDAGGVAVICDGLAWRDEVELEAHLATRRGEFEAIARAALRTGRLAIDEVHVVLAGGAELRVHRLQGRAGAR